MTAVFMHAFSEKMVKPLKKYEKTMEGAPIHYLNPTELSWIWRKPQRQIDICNIICSNPIRELCRFFFCEPWWWRQDYFFFIMQKRLSTLNQRLAMLALREGWVGQIAHCLGRFPYLCSFHFVSQLMLRPGSTTKLTMLSPCHLRLPTLVYCGLSWEKTSPWQL